MNNHVEQDCNKKKRDMSNSTRPFCGHCRKYGHKEETCWYKMTSNMSKEELGTVPTNGKSKNQEQKEN